MQLLYSSSKLYSLRHAEQVRRAVAAAAAQPALCLPPAVADALLRAADALEGELEGGLEGGGLEGRLKKKLEGGDDEEKGVEGGGIKGQPIAALSAAGICAILGASPPLACTRTQ